MITKTFECLIVLFTFIKVTFYLRIFESFSDLVQMLISVIQDLRSFLALFAFFILAFAVLLAIVDGDLSHTSNYHETGGFTYVLLALRQSIGDYDTGSFLYE